MKTHADLRRVCFALLKSKSYGLWTVVYLSHDVCSIFFFQKFANQIIEEARGGEREAGWNGRTVNSCAGAPPR